MEQEQNAVKKSNGKRNKAAGHGFERAVVNEFKAIGFEAASTSRLQSRSRDNAKVDLCNCDEHIHGRLPYNIQCKNVAGGLNYRKFLAEMPVGVEINVVLHNSTEKTAGGIFRTQGQYAMLSKKDFYRMVETNLLLTKLLAQYSPSLPARKLKELEKQRAQLK
jgi:hypothetical protein